MTTAPRIGHITIDCEDPKLVAQFWSEVFVTKIVDDWGDFIRLAPGPGGIQLAFAKVPERRIGKNRVHLDLVAEDYEAEVLRVVGLGAIREQDHETSGFHWTVLGDVEGNEFCISGDGH